MSLFINILLNHYTVSNTHLKKLCFLNNVRSKYLTVILIITALLFTLYDIKFIQNTESFHVFLLHFKTDLVFLVLSFVFTLYIFFNQVRSHDDIHNHHKYIHGIITVVILCWSVFKSVFFIQYNGGSYNITIICVLLTGFIYVYQSRIHMIQLLITIALALIISLLLQFSVTKIVEDTVMLVIVCAITYITSRYILYLQLKVLLKEKELVRYRQKSREQ